MDKGTSRGERRKKTNSIWLNRLNNEYNSNKSMYKDIKNANDLKNTHIGQLLKNTNTIDKKSSWEKCEIKNNIKSERCNCKNLMNETKNDYNLNNNIENSSLKLTCLKDNLNRCINDILDIERQLEELPERLECLKAMKREIEEEICWLQLNNDKYDQENI